MSKLPIPDMWSSDYRKQLDVYINGELPEITKSNLINKSWTYDHASYTDYENILNEKIFRPSSVNVKPHNKLLQIELDDGSVQTISRDELVKYIGERQIRQENEVVRTMWDRYQVAIKLVRSTDHGNEGS